MTQTAVSLAGRTGNDPATKNSDLQGHRAMPTMAVNSKVWKSLRIDHHASIKVPLH